MTEVTTMGFKREGEPAFENESENENDNSSESSAEKTTIEQTQSQEGEENSGEEKHDDKGEESKDFSKHPRWKEREDDWKERFNEQEKRHMESIEKLRQEFTSKSTKSTDVDIPEWFGGDEEQWAKYQEYEESKLARAKELALNEIKQKTESEQKAIDEATEYFNNQIAEIESNKTINPDGLPVDKNKLMKLVLDEQLVDTQGRWNYKAGFKMMRAGLVQAKSKTIDEKKSVASATTSETKAETKKDNVMTSQDFKDPNQRPW